MWTVSDRGRIHLENNVYVHRVQRCAYEKRISMYVTNSDADCVMLYSASSFTLYIFSDFSLSLQRISGFQSRNFRNYNVKETLTVSPRVAITLLTPLSKLVLNRNFKKFQNNFNIVYSADTLVDVNVGCILHKLRLQRLKLQFFKYAGLIFLIKNFVRYESLI